ncbi:MAG: ketoacyl-ACP synthase III [Victivallaceae bacterium]|nr:ketoacyl-ACP synthase III [Victivallaceae bacterium]
MSIVIAGTGSYVPEKILTNADLEKMVETSDEWIRTRTGIEERRIAEPGQASADLAYEAGCRALEAAGITGADLDTIIVATVTPNHVFPSNGCILQAKLGATKAFCFDVEAACSGLLYTLEIGRALLNMIPSRRYALVIGAEKLSCITDWSDRNTCVLFGDGAGAVVLEKTAETEDGRGIIATDIHSDGNYAEILKMPAGGSRIPATEQTVRDHLHFIKMEGRETFKLAVNAMVSAAKTVMVSAGVASSEIGVVIPHQANLRIINAVAQRLDVPEDRLFVNINKYGNTSAASIGICMDEAIRSGRVKRGDVMLLTTFGGGLTWGAALIRY